MNKQWTKSYVNSGVNTHTTSWTQDKKVEEHAAPKADASEFIYDFVFRSEVITPRKRQRQAWLFRRDWSHIETHLLAIGQSRCPHYSNIVSSLVTWFEIHGEAILKSVFQYGVSVVSESYTGLAKAHRDSESRTLTTEAMLGASGVVDIPYWNIFKCLGQADVADYSSGHSWVGRFNSCGVCFNMVKLFDFNGHTPLVEFEVTILKCIVEI